MVAYVKGPRGKADRIFSKVVRGLHGECQRCGSQQNLQCAHIVGRRFGWTRTDLKNAWCLCAGCHIQTTHEKRHHYDLIFDTIGYDEYDRLWRKAQDGGKMPVGFWEAEIDRLRDIAEENGIDL